MSRENVTRWLSERSEIENIYACVCDLNGTLRGKRLPVSEVGRIIDGGLRMPLSILSTDIWGEDVTDSELVFETGDADGLCDFTGRGLIPVSWTSRPAAIAQLWMRQDDGTPFSGDPRRALADVLTRVKARGLTPVVATELEFYLFDPAKERPRPPVSPVTGKRLHTDNVLSLDELQHFDGFLNDVYRACQDQGIPADGAIAENGAGQFEINMRHSDDALRAADDVVLFKRLVRGLARKHGYAATFMAKPYGERAGNGFHLHMSMVDAQGRNLFDDGGELGTDLMRKAVAGLTATMQECTLAFAPHENSFRRLMPGTHAPCAVAWGYENRTAAIRIPGGSPKARRIEHRVAGADANPYLVLACVIGGALIGIEADQPPPEPIVGDAYRQALPHLPLDWASAIDAFATGTNIRKIFSPRLQKMLVECKQQEHARFSRHVTEFEYHSYLEVV